MARLAFRFLLLVSLALLAPLTLAPLPALGQDATPAAGTLPDNVTVVASGLTNPRGFTWGEDGTLIVSLAGIGGPNLPTEIVPIIEAFGGFFAGPSASIARIEDGCPVTVAASLPSYIDGTGAATGVSSVAFLDGQLYATVDGGGAVHGNPDQPAGLYRINEDGSAEVVANLSAWMRANPVAEQPTGDNDPEGEVFHMLPTADGHAFWVIESNQGQLWQITPQGAISRVVDLSMGHPVSTGLAPAPDGGVYVGNLSPAPFPDGAAKVIHVAPDGAVTDQWTGLTAVTGLAVGPDGTLYAIEMATGNLDEDPFILPGTGRLVRQTGPDTMEVVAEGLDFPIALDFGPDGGLYVGLPALGSNEGSGQIIRVDLSGEAAGASQPAPACPRGTPTAPAGSQPATPTA